jgi:hypothetical protein
MGRISTKLKGRFAVWSRQYRQEMGKLKKSFPVPKDVHDVQSLVAQGHDVGRFDRIAERPAAAG